jgi:hypothetical protein
VIYEHRYLKTPDEYIETVIVSGDTHNTRARGLAETSDDCYEDTADDNINWDQTVNSLVDNTLRDASETDSRKLYDYNPHRDDIRL